MNLHESEQLRELHDTEFYSNLFIVQENHSAILLCPNNSIKFHVVIL